MALAAIRFKDVLFRRIMSKVHHKAGDFNHETPFLLHFLYKLVDVPQKLNIFWFMDHVNTLMVKSIHLMAVFYAFSEG